MKYKPYVFHALFWLTTYWTLEPIIWANHGASTSYNLYYLFVVVLLVFKLIILFVFVFVFVLFVLFVWVSAGACYTRQAWSVCLKPFCSCGLPFAALLLYQTVFAALSYLPNCILPPSPNWFAPIKNKDLLAGVEIRKYNNLPPVKILNSKDYPMLLLRMHKTSQEGDKNTEAKSRTQFYEIRYWNVRKGVQCT